MRKKTPAICRQVVGLTGFVFEGVAISLALYLKDAAGGSRAAAFWISPGFCGF